MKGGVPLYKKFYIIFFINVCALEEPYMNFLNVGHFGHGYFSLVRFDPDISPMDISENAKGGRFVHNNKWWVGDGIKYYICIK